MTKKELIQEFVAAGRIAVVGVSRNKKKFGYSVFRDLRSKGYDVVPVNPNINDIDGTKCYQSVNDVPGVLNYVVTVVPPDKTEVFVKTLVRKDIKTIWMQSGSESAEVIENCRSAGIAIISKECILMYADPKGFHKIHRFVANIFGKTAV